MTVDVTAVSDAPTAANEKVVTLEDTAHTFTAAEFSADFADAKDAAGSAGADSFSGILIPSLGRQGSLSYNGTALTAADLGTSGFTIAAANIGLLSYAPVGDANGTGYASFGFKVQDSGSTA